MKKYFIIGMTFISILGHSQRRFPDFPVNDAPVGDDILLLWDIGTAVNQQIKFSDLLYDDMVHEHNLNDDIIGDGMVRLANDKFIPHVDSTTINIVGGKLVSSAAASLPGIGTYIFTSEDYSDTFKIIVGDNATDIYQKGENDLRFYVGENDYLSLQLIGSEQRIYHNGVQVMNTTSGGIRIDDALYLNGSGVYISSDGTTLSFTDISSGTTYSLLELSNTSLDLSGSTDSSFLINYTGSLYTSPYIIHSPTANTFLFGSNGSEMTGEDGFVGPGYDNDIGGQFNFIGAGQYNDITSDYSGILCAYDFNLSGNYSAGLYGSGNDFTGLYNCGGGSNVDASGNFDNVFGDNITATGHYNNIFGRYLYGHDYGETAFGYYNTLAAGNQSAIAAGNRIFAIGNGTGTIARSNALEVYHNGLVYAPDSIRSPVIKATTDIEIRDTSLLPWLEEHVPNGGGSVDTSSAFTATELLVATGANTAKSEDSLTWVGGEFTVTGNTDLNGILFTGSTKTAGSFYTGTSNPTNTNRLNYDGLFYSYGLFMNNSTGGNGLTRLGGSYTENIYLQPENNRSLYIYSDTYNNSVALIDNFSDGSNSAGLVVRTYNGKGIDIGLDASTNSNDSATLLNIRREETNHGSYDVKGNFINIVDNPTTSGTISGKVLSATIGSTERIKMLPRAADGFGSVAYLFDTHELLTGATDTLFAIKNNDNVRFSLSYSGNGYFNGDVNCGLLTTNYNKMNIGYNEIVVSSAQRLLMNPSTTSGKKYLFGSSNYLNGIKHTVFMNYTDTLFVMDSVRAKLNVDIFNINNSLIVYPDSITYTGYIVADSFVMTDRTVVSDFVFEKGYNYGTFWDDLQYAMQNKTLPALKERSRNLAKRQENTIESLERLYLQMADELKKRDKEIARLEKKIDRIQLFKNEKMLFTFIGLLFIWCIALTLRKSIRYK